MSDDTWSEYWNSIEMVCDQVPKRGNELGGPPNQAKKTGRRKGNDAQPQHKERNMVKTETMHSHI